MSLTLMQKLAMMAVENSIRGNLMGNITDRQRTLREGVEAGLTLKQLADTLPHENGKPLSRQRVLQLVDRFDLRARRNAVRKKVREAEKAKGSIEFLSRRPRGRLAVNILESLSNKGYAVTWGRSIQQCTVEGFPVSLHTMGISYGGRYHTNSARPDSLRICYFPTGKIIMVLPEFSKTKETLNFREEQGVGENDLIPPTVLRQMLAVYGTRLRNGRIGRLRQAVKNAK